MFYAVLLIRFYEMVLTYTRSFDSSENETIDMSSAVLSLITVFTKFDGFVQSRRSASNSMESYCSLTPSGTASESVP